MEDETTMTDDDSRAPEEGAATQFETDEGAAAQVEESASPWAPVPAQVHRYKDADAVGVAAARRFLDTALRAVKKNDRFIVVLSGGRTPRALYRVLAAEPYRDKVPWSKTLFVFGDERCVPPDDEQSNYRMAKETLFDPLEIPPHQVFRMKGEQTPAEAAQRYEVRLGDLFLGASKRHFDLVLLGLGADGHTASLFPGSESLEEKQRWVLATQAPGTEQWRITLTLPALRSARRILFLATGEEKAQTIAEAFGGVEHEGTYPCEMIAPLHVRREVLVDRPAASRMPHDQQPTEEDGGDG